MTIFNFSTLLDGALAGNQKALIQWGKQSFDKTEIALTLQEIERLSFDGSPQKSYALNLRAFMHQRGLGGKQDYEAAAKLYDEAIGLGNATAMLNRAGMHQENKNYAEAIALLEKAIQLGNDEAMITRAYLQMKQELLNFMMMPASLVIFFRCIFVLIGMKMESVKIKITLKPLNFISEQMI